MNPLLEALYEGIQQACPETPPTLDRFDWDAAGIQIRYIICMTPRSGSTWLGHLLDATGLCGKPGEFFNNDVIPSHNRHLKASSFPDYFNRVVHTAQSASTFGFKINFNRMRWLCELIDLEDVFLDPGTRFVALYRRDVLAQAISTLKAIKTRVWHRAQQDGTVLGASAEPATDLKEPVTDLDDSEIWGWILNLIIEEQRWETFFDQHGVTPLRLNYEDLVTNPRQQVLRILRYVLGERVDASPAALEQVASLEGTTRRLADEHSWRIWSRFLLTYFDELESVYKLRSGLDVNEFRRHLRQKHDLRVGIRE